MKTLFLLAALLACISASHAQTAAQIRHDAEALADAKKYGEAMTLVEDGLGTYSHDVRLLLYHAHLQDMQGERLKAVRELQRICIAFPENDTVANSMGVMYEMSGQLDSALIYFTRLRGRAKTRRDSFSAELNMGSVYQYQQDYRRAVGHLEVMRKKFPDSLAVLTNLAQAYSDNGEKEKALPIMESVAAKSPGAEGALTNLGFLYTQMGKYPQAKTTFERALKASPDDALVLNNYGYLLYKMKDYSKALQNINKSIGVYKSNSYAFRNRALVYIAQHRMAEACADLNAGTELGFKMYYGGEVDELKEKYCAGK